uniref:Uncharacterized protein n=1 Tax=Strongyloides papillosus TaxID=174720 RepID=A0A0N5CC13_STREA
MLYDGLKKYQIKEKENNIKANIRREKHQLMIDFVKIYLITKTRLKYLMRKRKNLKIVLIKECYVKDKDVNSIFNYDLEYL